MSSRRNTSNSFRSNGNKREVERVFSGKVEGAIYAKVVAQLGHKGVRVCFENKHKKMEEGVAIIRGLYSRKEVPIRVNDVVCILPGLGDNYQLWCVFSSKETMELQKRGDIPRYYAQDVNSDDFVKKDKVDAFEFDYSDASAEEYNAAIDAI